MAQSDLKTSLSPFAAPWERCARTAASLSLWGQAATGAPAALKDHHHFEKHRDQGIMSTLD